LDDRHDNHRRFQDHVRQACAPGRSHRDRRRVGGALRRDLRGGAGLTPGAREFDLVGRLECRVNVCRVNPCRRGGGRVLRLRQRLDRAVDERDSIVRDVVVVTFRAMGCEVVVDGASGAELAAVADLFGRRDATFSRFDPSSELNRVNSATWDPVLASDDFARMLAVAVGAARETGGLVTPAVGAAVVAAGYDRDFDAVLDDARPAARADVPDWRRLRIVGRLLFRAGVTLDLNGVVKGETVDDALAFLAGGGTVSAGGDIATTRAVSVSVPQGDAVTLYRGGLATSGTDRRRW